MERVTGSSTAWCGVEEEVHRSARDTTLCIKSCAIIDCCVLCQSTVLTAKSALPLYIMSSKPCAHVGFPLDHSPHMDRDVTSLLRQPSPLPFPRKNTIFDPKLEKCFVITWIELETGYFLKLIITTAQCTAVPGVRDSTIMDFLSLAADRTRCHRCQVRAGVMEVEIIRRALRRRSVITH